MRLTQQESDEIVEFVDELINEIHNRWAVPKGWWTDIATGQPKKRNVGELIALCHSELSEALEGHRKSLTDEHCPNFTSLEVELADCIIRICDMAGGLRLRLAEALVAKMQYNHDRVDHTIESRKQDGGKKF